MSIHAYPAGSAYPQLGLDPTLQALADLDTSADTAPYFTAVDQAALMTVTPFARSLLDDSDQASMWVTLGLDTLGTVGGTGLASKLAVWSDAETLTFDTDLHYDATNNRLGIGTETPRYTLDIPGGQAQILRLAFGNHVPPLPTDGYGLRGGNAALDGLSIGRGSVAPSSSLDVEAASGVGAGILRIWETSSTLLVRSHAYFDTTIGMNVLDVQATGALGAVTKLTGVAVANFPATPPEGQGIGYWTGMNAGTNRYGFYAGGTADNAFMGRVGIGTITPTAPLTFATTEAQKIHLWASGMTRYGLAIASSQLQVFAGATARVSLGEMSGTDGTTFTTFLDASAAGVHVPGVPVGFSTPPVNGWGLRVGPYPAYFGGTMTAANGMTLSGLLDVSGGVIHALNRTGDGVYALYSTIMAAGGTNRWGIIHAGDAPSRFAGSVSAIGGIGAGIDAQTNWALYTNTNWSYFGGRVGIGIAPGHMLHVQGDLGVATTSTLVGSVGIGGGPDGNWNLRNYGNTYLDGNLTAPANVQLGRTGVAYAPDPSYWLRSGNAYFDAIASGSFYYNVGGARWPLDINGAGHVLQLGVHHPPPSAVWFRTSSATMDSLYLGGGDTAPAWALHNEGPSMLRRLGVGVDPNPLAANTFQVGTYSGFGYAPVAGLSIRAGNSYFDAIGCGYAGGSGYALRAGSTYVDAFTAAGNTALNGYTAVWGPPDARWAFVNWNTSYFAGSVQFGGLAGFGYAPQAGYWIRAGACNLDSVTTGGLTTGGGVTIGTDLVVGNWAGKPGGGLWADSSSRTMKTAIATIAGALALLLAQQGRQYEWTEPTHRAVLPGMRYGLVLEEVTIPQWVQTRPGKAPLLSIQGFEALTIEALREIVTRLEALERKAA